MPSSILKHHYIGRALKDAVMDLHESHGITFSDFVDFSFSKGMLRTIASVNPARDSAGHLSLCLRCSCGNCAENIQIRESIARYTAQPGRQHQSREQSATPGPRQQVSSDERGRITLADYPSRVHEREPVVHSRAADHGKPGPENPRLPRPLVVLAYVMRLVNHTS